MAFSGGTKSDHFSITRIEGVAETKLLTAKIVKISQRAQKTSR
jgi:hypothetical protein